MKRDVGVLPMSQPNGVSHGSASSSAWRRVWGAYDLGNWLLVLALVALLASIQMVEPHHRFIINRSDPSINYPLLQQQVPLWLLAVLALGVPVAVILLMYALQRHLAHAKKELYYVLFGLVYSMLLTLILTEFIKRVSGRPRPNFVAMAGFQADGQFTGAAADVREAFQSFPSGHTSTSFAGLGYLALYLFRLSFPAHLASREVAILFHVNQGYKTVVCFLPLWLATWIGLTRIVDYWHNFDDVSIGAFLGLGVTMLAFQMHVNWWWTSLHGTHPTPLGPGQHGEQLDQQGAGNCSNANGQHAKAHGPRRNSGPSIVPIANGGNSMASPTGRRSVQLSPVAARQDDALDQPLLDGTANV